jgi:hypothetical protein
MKKGIAMLLALTMAFGMTACSTGSSSGNGSNSGNGSGSGNADATTTQAVENNEADDSAAKDLVSDKFIDPIADWSKYDELVA